MTSEPREMTLLHEVLAQTNAMLEFVLAHGLPMKREGLFRYHGVAEPVWHPSQKAAILGAMAELPGNLE